MIEAIFQVENFHKKYYQLSRNTVTATAAKLSIISSFIKIRDYIRCNYFFNDSIMMHAH